MSVSKWALLASAGIAAGCTASPPPSAAPEAPGSVQRAPAPPPSAREPAASPPPASAVSTPVLPPQAWEESPLQRLPPEFVKATFEHASSFSCGTFSVELHVDNSATDPTFVRVLDKTGRRVYQARGREYSLGAGEPRQRMSLEVDWCGDLSGDGVPELSLTERTMGAHCCYTHYIVSLTTPVRRLLMWEKGDGGHGILPAKLKAGATWQLLSWDIIMPPFSVEAGDPVLSYATTPSFPVVFELAGGQFQKRTFAFKEGLAKRRADERAECRERPQQCESNELIEWGYGLIIGDWEKEKLTAVPDEELRRRLDARSAAMKRLLEQRLGR